MQMLSEQKSVSVTVTQCSWLSEFDNFQKKKMLIFFCDCDSWKLNLAYFINDDIFKKLYKANVNIILSFKYI